MKKILALMLCLLMVLSVIGCSPKAEPAAEAPAAAAPATEATAAAAPAEPSSTGRLPELLINVDGEPSRMDCVVETNDDSAIIVIGAVYEKLLSPTADREVRLELAESFEVSPDNKQYTYHLRKGIKFHDGQEMLAEDVVSSMNRWLDYAGTADTMVGGARFEAVDDYTVTIKMDVGTAYLNDLIATFGQHALITTKECNEEAAASNDGMLKSYVGTGPYKWGDWVSASHFTLYANDEYQPYGTPGDFSGLVGYKTAYYDKVTIRITSDSNTAHAAMQTGEYDISNSLDMSYYDLYKDDPNFGTMVNFDNLNAVIFNKKQGWGANEKFRQAVQALVNVDDCMYAYLGDESLYTNYSSYMFPGPWYTEAGKEYFNQHNKERALELFTEAGFTADDTFIILCASDSTSYLTFAQVIQSEMAEIGLKCELLTYEWGTFTDVRNNQPENYNAFLTAFGPKTLPNLNLFLSSTWAGWCTDERIQNDLAAISSASSMEEGLKIWEDLQLYMLETSVPIVKLGVSAGFKAFKSNIEGVDYFERLVWVNAHPKAQ